MTYHDMRKKTNGLKMVDIFRKIIHIEPTVFCVKFVQDFNQSRDHDPKINHSFRLQLLIMLPAYLR
jgi:hypothetical protein